MSVITPWHCLKIEWNVYVKHLACKNPSSTLAPPSRVSSLSLHSTFRLVPASIVLKWIVSHSPNPASEKHREKERVRVPQGSDFHTCRDSAKMWSSPNQMECPLPPLCSTWVQFTRSLCLQISLYFLYLYYSRCWKWPPTPPLSALHPYLPILSYWLKGFF